MFFGYVLQEANTIPRREAARRAPEACKHLVRTVSRSWSEGQIEYFARSPTTLLACSMRGLGQLLPSTVDRHRPHRTEIEPLQACSDASECWF